MSSVLICRPIDGNRKSSIIYALQQQLYLDLNDAATEGSYVTDNAKNNLSDPNWRRWSWYPGYLLLIFVYDFN